MRTFLALAAAALLAAAAPAQRAVGSAYAQQAQALRELQYQVQTLAARFDAIEQRQSSLAARIAALERGAATCRRWSPGSSAFSSPSKSSG